MPNVCVPSVSTLSVSGPMASHGFGNLAPVCFSTFLASFIAVCVCAKAIPAFGNARFE